MGAHTGSRGCSPSTSTARRRTRPPVASSAAMAAARRPSPTTKPTMSKDVDAAEGKARAKACSRRRDMEVRKKMEVLRRLVPSSSGGGDGDGDEVDELLLLRAAGYIAQLQAQVTVMQFMVDVLEDAKH
ncbi:hypothetical protein BDA96_09G055800 [Sorghum bicolor]|uniref:BHLH domain-containing protein n=1 Tax=Sorghum bicolor TaxID=4558 RepID=A0A921U3Y4_SORBI|nr:hypothetical protein BDA96_09G055800 [Sorghum bicolor]